MEVVSTAPPACKPSCSTCNCWIAVIITITSQTSCVINWKQIDVLPMWPYQDWIHDWEKKVGYLYSLGGCDKQRHAQRKWERESEVQKVRMATPVGKNWLQCFSYRRFFASPDASSLIWTQVERFGRFFQVQFSMRLLRCRNHRNQNRSSE